MGEEMTRDEHLAWCKERALEYVKSGDLPSTVASMISDLQKHSEFNDEATLVMGQLATIDLMNGAGPETIRRWIEGFH